MRLKNLQISSEAAERFWRHVDKRGPDECWLWLASTFGNNGYGQFTSMGQRYQAHRVAFLLSKVDPAENLVLHHCDNPICVNPGHLFLGTQLENMRDAAGKGRLRKTIGSASPHAKLTEEMIAPIVCCAQAGVALRALARWFGVSKQTVQRVVSRRNWSHVPIAI